MRQYTYVHSTMGDLAVGNADGPEGDAPIGTATRSSTTSPEHVPDRHRLSGLDDHHGLRHLVQRRHELHDLRRLLATSSSPSLTIGNGYLVDYDSATGQFTNWTSFAYPNGVVGQDFVTHFQGISSTEQGVYTLSCRLGSERFDECRPGLVGDRAAQSRRLVRPRRLGQSELPRLSAPVGLELHSVDSVAGNQVVGIVIDNTGMFSYQATVNTGFQLSNVISGNGGNGIGIYGASGNPIAMNNIGTDASGTLTRGNAKNGILVTKRRGGNFIGGQATGGNDPTAGVFVRPPQGNLISGNRGNGVLINNGATQTLLSGNFVGTSASGNSALGNRQDGVAIVERQRQSTDRLHVPAGSVCVLQRAQRQRRQRPADHQFQQHDGPGQFHGRRGQQRHGRGQRRRRAPGLGLVQEHAGRRRDPARQRDLRQQPQRHRGDATGPADSRRSTPSPESSPSAARRRTSGMES